MPSTRLKWFLGRLGIGLLAMFLALGCLEIYLRINGPLQLRALISEGQFLEMRGGEILLKPGTVCRLLSRTGEFEHEVRINSSGFRDNRELPTSKPASERRLAFLGDSFTFGYGSDFTNSIPRLVEELLNAGTPDTRYRSLNFGFRSGNCPRPQYVFFQTQLPRHSVDEIFWMLFLVNDLDEMNYFRVAACDEHGLPARLETPMGTLSAHLKKLALWQMARVPLKGWFLRRQTPVTASAASVAGESESPYSSQVAEITRMARVMWQKSKAVNQKFYIVFLMLGPMPSGSPLPAVTRSQINLMNALEREGIPFIDLSKMYEGLTASEISASFYHGDGHFTPLGNRLAAQCLVRAVTSPTKRDGE